LSSKPIRLDKAFRQGVLTRITVQNGGTYTVPTGSCILVLSGSIGHVTLTDSVVEFRMGATLVDLIAQTRVQSTEATGIYSLFNMAASATQMQFSFIILNFGCNIVFNGGANSYINILALEWMP